MAYLNESRGVAGWCAAHTVKEVFEPEDYDEETHNLMIKGLTKYTDGNTNGSVLVITINEDEKELIPHLKKFGYKKWPWVKNWAHDGRRTCMMVYQLDKRTFTKNGGINWDRED